MNLRLSVVVLGTALKKGLNNIWDWLDVTFAVSEFADTAFGLAAGNFKNIKWIIKDRNVIITNLF